MNIVTPMPTSLVYPTANVNTEAARRDNLLRDTIPQSANSEQSASEKGLGSESDKARNPGQPPAPVTYERPVAQQGDSRGESQAADAQHKDNGQEQSAGRENAEQQQQQQREIEQLKSRDAEVRQHEQAHAVSGGQHASAPAYEFDTGPDGKRYAVGGEVSIDVSEAHSPEQTLHKMEQVRQAALAPAEPSMQDRQVASEANQKAREAREELAQQNQAEDQARNREPVFSLQSDPMQQRIGRIQHFYQTVSNTRDAGFSASA